MLIKVIDRLHNMQTLGSMSVSKVSKITTETLISFITSSMYVGILEVEQLLLDSCIYYNHEQNKESYRAKPVFSFNNNSSILSLVS